LDSADIAVLELVGPGVVHDGVQAHIEVGEHEDIDCDVTIIEGDVAVVDVFAEAGADLVQGRDVGMPPATMWNIDSPKYRAVDIKDCVKVLAAELSSLPRNPACIWGLIERDSCMCSFLGRQHV
jgi:hypothetical protein